MSGFYSDAEIKYTGMSTYEESIYSNSTTGTNITIQTFEDGSKLETGTVGGVKIHNVIPADDD
jgi:hypothetical protein